MANILIKQDKVDLKTNSEVKEVTLYFNKARVRRTLTVKLPPGESVVEFLNLGDGIDESSVKTAIKPVKNGNEGAGAPSLGSATVVKNHLYFFKEAEDEAKYREILEGIKKLIAIMDNKTACALESYIIRDLQGYIQNALNSILLEEEIPITKLREGLSLLEQKLAQNSLQVIELNENFRVLSEKVSLLRAGLEKIRALDSRVQNNIQLSVTTGKEMEIEVQVVYQLPGAWWKASYDAKLDPASGKVHFLYFGELRQQTGEDWESAEFKLSSSETKPSLIIPPVYPLYVSGYEQKRDKSLYVQRTRARDDRVEEEAEPEESKEEGGENISTGQVISVKKTATAYNFSVLKPYTILSDGLWHRVLIKEDKMDCRTVYETTPEALEYFYLRCDMKNDTGLPILPGKVSLYRNGSYMGKSNLKYCAPGQDLALSFGIDEDLRVKRLHYNRHRNKKKSLLKNERYWDLKFILYNHKPDAQKVILKEAIYVSKLKEVAVEILKETTTGYKQSKDGILSWELSLPPDPFKYTTVIIGYKMTSPKSFDLEELQ